MEYVAVLIVAGLVFGVCFLVDKLFTRIFRNQAQHKSGKSVRLNKRFGSIGLIMAVLGIAALVLGFGEGWALIAAGSALVLGGACMVVYYMTFGIFYDEESFILTSFGKKSTVYRYADICTQQLYVASGNVVVELYLSDGRTVQLQQTMGGVYPFLDFAFSAWLRQTGKTREECTFYDPQNSCWFPPTEG